MLCGGARWNLERVEAEPGWGTGIGWISPAVSKYITYHACWTYLGSGWLARLGYPWSRFRNMSGEQNEGILVARFHESVVVSKPLARG